MRGAKGFELVEIEVRPIISDDAVRNSISEYQLSDEADSSVGIKILDRLSFNPLSELVDCHQYMGEAAPASSQWCNHMQSPNSEGPDEWNGFLG